MNFVESEFIGFLAVVLGLWLAMRRHERATQVMLLVASFVFYGFHQWQLVFLLGAYCLVNWAAAVAIASGKRRAGLTVGVGFDLAALAFWKYTPLIVNTVVSLVAEHDFARPSISEADWYLPIGISFYTFTNIAYLVDVYRGDAPAERDPFRFALFVSFFPHLVAGPILRAGEFLAHLQPGKMPQAPAAIREALLLMGRGFFKKLVIADGIGRAIDPFFAHVGDETTAGAWSLPYLYLYSLQIFFDFSGYTDIARGTGLLFGFRWPENFDRPYLAGSIRDFWRRWHMTLSRFLRDYLYISLGGGRQGAARAFAAVMATMLLGGLWHGAAWSFVIWGGLHGVYLVGHRLWQQTAAAAFLDGLTGRARQFWHAAAVVITFHVVTVTWSFFRLTDLRQSLACLEKLYTFDAGRMLAGNAGDVSLWGLVAAYLVIASAGPAIDRRATAPAEASPETATALLSRGALWGTIAALFAFAYILAAPGHDPFIYFQF